jgi:hypothetical protein
MDEYMREKRCLKFTGYLYIPTKEDIKDKAKLRRYLSDVTMGRIMVYDEFNQRTKKMKSFGNTGEMVDYIMRIYKKRTLKRLK